MMTPLLTQLVTAPAGVVLLLSSCQDPAPRPKAASITVFPVVLAGSANVDVANVVGSLLERGGMPAVEVAEATFMPDPAQDFAAQAAAFGAFVREPVLPTERALFVEILGSRAIGITELRSVLVDAAGKVLWSERQNAGDGAFDEKPPKEPLDSCVFVVQRLREPLGLADPLRSGAKEGKLGERMKQKAGVPPAAELEAMTQRLAALRKLGAGASIRVLPPRRGDAWSATDASDLATRLQSAGFSGAKASTDPVRFATDRSSNEQPPIRPYEQVFPRPIVDADQWQRVTATGTFDGDHQFVVRNRNNGDDRGYEIVTPLRTATGAVLVDRGFIVIVPGTEALAEAGLGGGTDSPDADIDYTVDFGF